MGELLAFYHHYRDGFLWFEGSLSDQPNVVCEAIALFAGIDAELTREEVDKKQAIAATEQLRATRKRKR